eukprot:CAMPEP_0170736094 /NCGR_PEP_ID=MMETSP0437-20130122/3437_1 /TAXON_ID=0 /ORGANISM="Sexangularia sp." /LENGTH=95 /DNA_ID=CAMNT_0011074445 /DNA_START=66 /DNA_END=353 /DNA_ORIENTATION=-
MTYTIVAIITAKPDKVDFVRAQIDTLVAATRQEEGNLQYDLHTDKEVSERFTIYETYEDEAAVDAHMSTAHFQSFQEATKDAIAKFDVLKLDKVD